MICTECIHKEVCPKKYLKEDGTCDYFIPWFQSTTKGEDYDKHVHQIVFEILKWRLAAEKSRDIATTDFEVYVKKEYGDLDIQRATNIINHLVSKILDIVMIKKLSSAFGLEEEEKFALFQEEKK